MDAAKLRAWWWSKQGLDGTLQGRSPAEVLEHCGWARSVGSIGPYLTMFSRSGIARKAVDDAQAARDIHELPAARGCTYVVPASQFALALKVGGEFRKAEENVAARLGVTEKEIDKLCGAVVGALAKGPLDPAAIREATGNASRSLGEEGKKKGLTTTLPVALGRLQAMGEIRRIPVDGQLMTQRYQYALWRPNPLARFKLSLEEAYTELARHYFRWIGPATPAEFQSFSGLGVKAGQAAIAPLQLVPMEPRSGRLLFPDDRQRLLDFKASATLQYALLSPLDGLALLRRDIQAMIDAKDAGRNVAVEKGTKALGGLAEFPNHVIVDRGRLVGLWEYDPETKSIVWDAFGTKGKALDAAIAATQKYLQEQTGDARSFTSTAQGAGRRALKRSAKHGIDGRLIVSSIPADSRRCL
jgi:hypothetical protein